MSNNEDSSQKTEDPTQKKLDDAKKKGNVPFSKELMTFGIFLCTTILLAFITPSLSTYTINILKPNLNIYNEFSLDHSTCINYIKMQLWNIGTIIIVPFTIYYIVTLLFGLVQNGLNISLYPVTPNISNISPLKGLNKIFSLTSIVELLKSILKISAIFTILYIAIHPILPELIHISTHQLSSILSLLHLLLLQIFQSSLIVMFIITIADLSYQKYKNINDLKMSKEDIKKEMKDNEVSQELKLKMKKLMKSKSHLRLNTLVPDSDVIITNPTHIAIAIKYEQETMPAPKIQIKGQGYIAQEIKKIAQENLIPIVENKPLARKLYADKNIVPGQYITTKYYKAIAEIINYVNELNKNKL